MKKTITTSILVAVLGFTALTANAKSWRINSDVTKKADFVDINAAMSSENVTAGDTLYLDPGCNLTSNQSVTKAVTIVGPGYLRNDAPHQGAVFTGKLYLKQANTKVEGVIMRGDNYIQAQYVTIERCYIQEPVDIGYNSTNAQYSTIKQCYILNYIEGHTNINYSGYSTIVNNIIISNRDFANGSGGVVNGLPYATIANNYIAATHNGTYYNAWVIGNITGGEIENNILLNTGKAPDNILANMENCKIRNNIMSCIEGTYTTIGDNIYLGSNDESLVFALEGTYDQRYQLKNDSPAKGYATDGGDCGPFDGGYPYVLYGLPAGYPYYTKANINTRAKDGKINVSLKIKMQNE